MAVNCHWIAVALLIRHCSAVLAQGCEDPFTCFEYNFGACSDADWPANRTDNNPVALTLLNVEGSVGGQWQSHLVSSLLRLLCEEYRPHLLPGRAGPPYCVVEEEAEVGEKREMCRNCSCIAINYLVINRWSGAQVPSASVAELLNEQKTRLALRFAGFTVLSATTNDNGDGGRLSLFDVPLLSWVCVGLGVLVSSLTLLKPLWWDRLLASLRCSGSKKEKAIISPTTAMNESEI